MSGDLCDTINKGKYMFQIRTYNKISDKGLSLFSSDKYIVSSSYPSPDALILRSQKLHDETIADSVIAVARAGAGTNNIPTTEYTERGIVVFNTPGANANAVKELVLSGLLLSSRGIVQGRDFVNSLGHVTDSDEMSKILEKEKKQFAGNELTGKTLGVIGLGAIGSLVADIALALGMQVVGFDPALSIEAAWKLSSRVEKMETMEELLARADFLSLHVPAIPATKHLINKETLKLMKPSAIILNFARSAIVDPEAVVNALNDNKLGQYICDFPEPILIGHNKVIAVPHIGASTAEAEENCAVMAANQLKDYLENGNIKNSVNFPQTAMPRGDSSCRLTFANKNISGILGNFLSIFTDNDINIIDMVNKSRDDVAYNILDLDSRPNDNVIKLLKDVEHIFNLRRL